MEGTPFGRTSEFPRSERVLEDDDLQIISKTNNLVLASFSPIHVDRLITFYHAARRAGRTLVLDVYGAYILHLIHRQIRVPKPSAAAGIRVYFNAHFRANVERRGLTKIHNLFDANRIERADLDAAPDRYVMLFRPSMLDLDFNGAFTAPPALIYLYWSGYRTKPKWIRVEAAVHAAGGEFREAHTSGHISIGDIHRFVDAVHPKQVVPIHTQDKAAFAAQIPSTRLVDDGEVIEVE